MKLQLVSKEQAVRLRDIDFPQDKHDLGYTICNCSDRFNVYKEGTLTENASSMIKKVSAPSLELVAKWLREEKNLWIEISKGGYEKSAHCFLGDYIYEDETNIKEFNSYEEALSAGIDKAIGILKKNDND